MPQEANMDELIEGAAQNLELALANDPRTATPLQASEAEMALTSLFSHRGDGTPTQYFHGSEVAGHADTMWKALITTLRTLATMQAREAELVGACNALIQLALDGGLTDDLLAQVYPDTKRKDGQPADAFAKRARRVVNEARAVLTTLQGPSDAG